MTASSETPKREQPLQRLFLFITLLFALFHVGRSYAETSVLFIGNSFTYGYGSASRFYRADTVTDLNLNGIGGVPALFKSFTDQAELDYAVFVETHPGSGLDFHLENKLGVIGHQPWDNVVMHGYSTMDRDRPGDSTLLVTTTAQMVEFLRGINPKVEIFLTATWSRADLVYNSGSPWSSTPIDKMASDLRVAYELAAAGPQGLISVNPVGEAWTRAMAAGLADPNPYDGIDFNKVNLWADDHYHASDYGYYLEALIVFGNLTGVDPRALGANECSGFELGMTVSQVAGLQQAAFEQLASDKRVNPASKLRPKSVTAQPCGKTR